MLCLARGAKSKSEKIMLKFQNISRLHFALLTLVLFNLSINTAFGVGANNLLNAIELILYLSGILLFFVHVKPFKVITIYFSFFLFTPIRITGFRDSDASTQNYGCLELPKEFCFAK